MRLLRILIPALILAALTWAPSAQAVVGGTNTTIEAHPHQVRVLVSSGGFTYSCGGSIRDATHVVTAAHCVYIDDELAAPASVTVAYASTFTYGQTGAAVSEVTIPSQYLNQDSYDVALLDLAAPLAGYGGAKVDNIPPASASTLAAGLETQDAVATGWGATTEGGSGSSTLKEVPLPLRADSACWLVYGTYYVAERTVCAGGEGMAISGNPDTCQGDSGGPLALDSGSGSELVGITSYGTGCGRPGIPGAYTEPSDDEIGALIAGTSSSTLKGSAGAASPPPPAPVATTPPAATVAPPPPVVALRDTVRPRARVSYVSCKRRRCSFRIAARDSGGRVVALSVKVARRVRTCVTRDGARVCTYVTRTRKLTPRRISGGFSVRAKLVAASYKLTAVALDGSGNRSLRAVRSFRVR